jgi:hypothetical protein
VNLSTRNDLAKFYLQRGILIAAIGIVIVIIGTGLFDNSYEYVEPLMKIKHDIIEDQTILRNQSISSTIPQDELVEHNVIIAHVKPSHDSIKLLATDPSGETFEKESKDGFVYHIIDKKTQAEGNYSIEIYNLSGEPITVNTVFGEDPYLSGKCEQGYGMRCYTIPLAIGFVIIGIITFIVGTLLAIVDFRRQKKLRNK